MRPEAGSPVLAVIKSRDRSPVLAGIQTTSTNRLHPHTTGKKGS